MPVKAPTYSVDSPHDDLVELGRATVLHCPVRYEGALVAPSSATFQLFGPAGTVVVAATAATISSSIAQYSLAALELTTSGVSLGAGWIQRWVFTFSDQTFTHDQSMALCRTVPRPSVSVASLQERVTNLSQLFTGGAAAVQGKINTAWAELMRRWTRDGNLSSRVKNPSAFYDAHLHLALALCFEDMASSRQGPDNPNGDRGAREREAYESAYKSIAYLEDLDEDGLPDGNDRVNRTGVVHMNAAPTDRIRVLPPAFGGTVHTYWRRGW